MIGVIERLKRKARTFAPRPVILMYHRVAIPAVDPWQLAVSPAHFDSQVAALKAERTVLSLTEYGARAASGELPQDAVAITFDDGYRDNFTAALPVLKRHDAPATLFLTTGYVGSKVEYWWDELARLMLDRNSGAEAYREAWARLKGLSEPERLAALAVARRSYGGGEPAAEDLPMTADEVAEFAADPLITLGAHSVTHASLKALGPKERAEEIARSRDAAQALSGRPVRVFAYPYGDLDEATREAVSDAGFDLACSTEQRSTSRTGEDPLRLPRMSVPDVDGAALLAQIRALP